MVARKRSYTLLLVFGIRLYHASTYHSDAKRDVDIAIAILSVRLSHAAGVVLQQRIRHIEQSTLYAAAKGF